MSKKDDAEVVREVTARIDTAIRDNRRSERIIVVTLLSLFGVGLWLIISGASSGQLSLLVPGGILQLTIAYPVARLVKLREDNVRLQIIPQLLRMADSTESKVLAAKLINRLIEQV